MKICLISLGCDKNLVDSEIMLSLLCEKGHQIVETEEEAEVVIINTCCFIHDAKEESINTILETAEYKKNGNVKAMIVTGCLAQRYHDEIHQEIPEADILVGTSAYADIVEAVDRIEYKKGSKDQFRDLGYLPDLQVKRKHFTGSTYAYLKIAEGCDKCCTYCIIPKIRGNYRSVPMERILTEAKQLAEEGIRELILVAQETTIYGLDLYGKKMLPELLKKLCCIEGIEWIRLLYCYPEEIENELIQVIAKEDRIVKYLDIPIQHASDSILKKMGRKTTRKEIEQRISDIRNRIPGVVLRTSLITGFPGETEGDFEELRDFVRKVRFDRLGVFTYSKEEGTPAARMRQQIPQKVKKERRDALMRLQQEIAFEEAGKKIGTTLRVQIEGWLPEEEIYVGRSYMDAPNVDGYVFVKAASGRLSGEFVETVITEARGYDLYGQIINEI